MQYEQLGRQIAHGSTSDVHETSDNTVVKLLRSHIPSEWAEREALITDAVHSAGLPAPAVLEVVVLDGRSGIVFERISGESMWHRMLEHPEEIPELAAALSRLQAEINATPAPHTLPAIADRLYANMVAANVLSDAEKAAAVALLAELPRGSGVCHFDVHPKNVILGASGPIAVDWFDAGAGHAAADVVRSSLLMRPGTLTGHLDRSTPELVAMLHGAYLHHVRSERNMAVDALLAWEPAITASRLAEPLSDAEISATLATWRAGQDDDRHSELASYLGDTAD